MTNFNQNSSYAVRRAHFIERAKALWGDAYDYSDLEFTTGKEPCYITCPKHGRFRVGMAQNHIMKNPKLRTGCPYCSAEKRACDSRLLEERRAKREAEKEKRRVEREKRAEERKEKRKLSGRKTIAEVKVFLSDRGYDVDGMSAQKICSIYGNLKYAEHIQARHAEKERKEAERKEIVKYNAVKRTYYRYEWYMSQAKVVHGSKYDYSQAYVARKRNGSYNFLYINNIICPIHGLFSQRADVHVKQQCGCPQCAVHTNELSDDERKEMWVKRCREKFNDRFDYSHFKYVNNDTKGIVVCREHNYAFLTDPWTHLRGSGGCPFCSGSVGEVHIRTWLENHHVAFRAQYRIPNENPLCKRRYLMADFFLPDFNMIVEMNGQQHYHNISFFYSHKWTLQDQQIRDNTLREYCKVHHLRLLEIKYNQIEQIPDILTQTLLNDNNVKRIV